MKTKNMKKTERPKYIWDLSHLFKGDDDPEIEKKLKEVEKAGGRFINKWKNRTDYLKDPAVLRKALDEYVVWKSNHGTDGTPGYYFWLRTQQDQNDPELRARFNRIDEFSRKIENEIQFFYLKLAGVSPTSQRRFLKYEGLKRYRHFLERIFAESRHLLSEPEERIMNLKATTASANWVRMTSAFLAKEERQVLLEDGSRGVRTLSGIAGLMNSRSKKVRDSSAAAFNEIMEKHSDVAEAELNSILANKKTDDGLRKFERPDQARHLADDIGSEIVDSLVRTVSGRNDIPNRFYKLKAGLMKMKRLRYHDRNAEYGEIKAKYGYNEACDLVTKVFRKLDPKFAEIFGDFMKRGLFDVYPRKGKGGGAFCIHHLISQPTFILLNHTGKLHDVLTLAHELGHGINNELIREKHHALNFGTPTSTAEVASTFMEDFVLQEIMRRSDDELRLAIMVMKLNDDVSTIFRQIACYRFEQELHQEFRKKGYLSKVEIGKIFIKHMSAYMGKYIEQSKGSEYWWVYWSHIRYFFYVYSYASGLLISKSLQNSVRNDPRFIEKVKEFLSAGLSDSPRNIFLKLDIDIAYEGFWSRGIDEVETLLHETERLAKKLGKI